MAKRYEDTGLILKKSEADDQVFIPVVVDLQKFGVELAQADFLKTAGRQRVAREAVVNELMDADGYEYRWQKRDDGNWVLQERKKDAS